MPRLPDILRHSSTIAALLSLRFASTAPLNSRRSSGFLTRRLGPYLIHEYPARNARILRVVDEPVYIIIVILLLLIFKVIKVIPRLVVLL